MKKNLPLIILLISIAFSFSSCEAIGAIFKAGVWSGVLLVVLVLVVIGFIISKAAGKK